MDGPRLGAGETIAGVSGLALLIVLFLPWYGLDVDIAGFTANTSFNAWESMDFIDVLLFLVALVAVGVPAARALGSMPADFPGAPLLLAAGVGGFLLVLLRVIDIPAPDIAEVGGDTVDFGREIGPFLGLIATAGIAFGGWRANGPPASPQGLRSS